MKNTLKIIIGLILLLAIFPFAQFMAEKIAVVKFDASQLLIIFLSVAGVLALFFSSIFIFSKVKL